MISIRLISLLVAFFINKSFFDVNKTLMAFSVNKSGVMSADYNRFSEKYGDHLSQEGDLYIPIGQPKAIVCFFHGGFWRAPYGRDQFDSVAIDFAQAGYIIWNIEYRRVGEVGGGWPGTFEDAILSVNYLSTLQKKYRWSDNLNVVLAGHSAGGQLALWLTAHAEKKFLQHTPLTIHPDLCIGLAPVVNFEKAYQENLGGQAIYKLLGCTPKENPERYTCYDPLFAVHLNTPQIILHGEMDEDLPIAYSISYLRAAEARNTSIDLIELEKTGHMDFLEPQSLAVKRWKMLLYLRYGIHK